MPEDLELIPTDNLVDELFSRFDLGVILLFKATTENAGYTIERAEGDLIYVTGMLEQLKFNMLNHLKEDQDASSQDNG